MKTYVSGYFAAGVDDDHPCFLSINTIDLSGQNKGLCESFGYDSSCAIARLKRANPVKWICPAENKKIRRKIFLLKIFPCFKSDRISAFNLDLFTGLWIASHPGFSIDLFE